MGGILGLSILTQALRLFALLLPGMRAQGSGSSARNPEGREAREGILPPSGYCEPQARRSHGRTRCYRAIMARIMSPAFSAWLLISPMYSIMRMRWKVVAGSFRVNVKTSLLSFLSI